MDIANFRLSCMAALPTTAFGHSQSTSIFSFKKLQQSEKLLEDARKTKIYTETRIQNAIYYARKTFKMKI